MQRFEDLIAWQKAKVLCVKVYKAFEGSKDFGFKDQFQRAAVSTNSIKKVTLYQN